MMYPPYSTISSVPKQRIEYLYCIQLGRHFRAAVGQPCPDEAALNKARGAGERIHIIPVNEPEEIKWPIWTYPCGSERTLCIAVDKKNTVRRLYVM
jgi:hypothetical protein